MTNYNDNNKVCHTSKLNSTLLIDIGNTNIKYILLPNTYNFNNFNQYPTYILNKNKLKSTIKKLDKEYILSNIHISNVANPYILNNIIKYFCHNKNISVHKSQQNFKSLINNYDDYTKLGSDRWLAIVEAYSLSRCNLIFIVSCGSATTLDIIYKDNYIGGYIIPGIGYMQTSLIKNTAQISNNWQATSQYTNFLDKDNNMPATNTTEGVNRGIILTQIGFIEKVITLFLNSKSNISYDLILHGGYAQQITNLLTLPHRLINNMVLRGLARIING